MLAHPSPRLDPLEGRDPRLRRAGGAARHASGAGSPTAAAGGNKSRVVQEFRNRCPDVLLPWIDAAVVLAGEDTFFPPLLGTGGNDGRLDFSTNFHQRLLDVIGAPGTGRARSLASARDLIAGTETEQLASAAVGQFDPASAGGPGSSRFGAAESLVNPWGYVLLVEGALLFAASAVRRNQHAAGRAAMPFTVQGSPDGSASGAAGEESRGEVWAPVWTAEFTLAEIKQLFAEARASWRGRPARRAVDFYAATRTLGVARGINEFTRYGLQRRNGLAFAAVPLDRVAVREHPEVRLAAEVEDWASRFSGSDTSAAVGQAARGFEAALLSYARDGGALPLARLLAALTRPGAGGRPQRPDQGRVAGTLRAPGPAIPGRSPANRTSGTAGRSRARVLRYLARPRPGRRAARTMRQLLLPVDPPVPGDRSQPNGRWRDAAIVPGFGSSPLPHVLADVLIWRSRTALAERDAGDVPRRPHVPLGHPGARRRPARLRPGRTGREDPGPVPASLPGTELAERAITNGKRAGRPFRSPRWPASPAGPRPPGRRPCEDDTAPGGEDPKLALNPDWAARLAAGQVSAVHDEAAARLRQAGWDAVPAPPKGTARQRSRGSPPPSCPAACVRRAVLIPRSRIQTESASARGAVMTAYRTVLEADLTPLAGSLFQPTGFPDLGAAEFERTPDDGSPESGAPDRRVRPVHGELAGGHHLGRGPERPGHRTRRPALRPRRQPRRRLPVLQPAGSAPPRLRVHHERHRRDPADRAARNGWRNGSDWSRAARSTTARSPVPASGSTRYRWCTACSSPARAGRGSRRSPAR